MTVFTGTVDGVAKPGHEQLFEALRNAICGYGTISNEAAGGGNVGDGTLENVDGRAQAVTETITLTAQGSGGFFTVSGSVTGAMDDAVLDHVYENDYITFEIQSGGTPFATGDTFTFDVTEGAAKTDGVSWDLLYESGGGSDGRAWFQGPGSSSGDEIFVNCRHYKSVANGRYNLEFSTCTAYDVAYVEDPTSQPGSSSLVYMTLWEQAMDYWIVVNERRFIMFAKVNTRYMGTYQGWYLPAGLPTEHPVPLLSSGQSSTSTATHSDGSGLTNFYNSPSNDGTQFRAYNGTWRALDNATDILWPWNGDQLQGSGSYPKGSTIGQGPGGGYMPLEALLFSTADSGNVYGILDGVYYISGFGNASENTFVWGSSTYIVFQNVAGTGIDDYCAIRLE